jgi:hypothetical protein
VAGNIGHIQPAPGHPVILADRLTAATSPVAAFAGLYIGLLVLKMTRPAVRPAREQDSDANGHPAPLARPGRLGLVVTEQAPVPGWPARTSGAGSAVPAADGAGGAYLSGGLLGEASRIYEAAAVNGDRISQRALARQLRLSGHRFSNEHLHGIAVSIGMTTRKAA